MRKPGIDFDALPHIDLVLVSHNHYDHLDLSTLKKLNKKFSPRFLVALGDKRLLTSHGIHNVDELDWWQSLSVQSDVSVAFAPTQHFSSRNLSDRNKSLWGSFMIQARGRLIYFGGDAAYSPHFQEIQKHFGATDIALLPIGAYEPRWFMKDVHMNPAEAVKAHLDLQSKQSIGIHFGTFQLTEEEIDAPVRDLKAALTEAKLDSSHFVTLAEGVTTIYSL